MLSYRYMVMRMEGIRDGDSEISTADALEDFMVAPTDMTTHMHMIGVMYAPANWLTFMGMVPFIFKEMDHVTRMGTNFMTDTEGVGDLRFSALVRVLELPRHRVHLNLGMSFPTGSINERDDTPAGNDVILPYPMQIGTGTYDLLPGITYLGQTERFSWGAQFNARIPLGENYRGYSVGERYEITPWAAVKLTDFASFSFRLSGVAETNYDGADPDLNPNLIFTADPNLRGSERINASIGLNLFIPQGPYGIRGQRLAVEAGLPVYQNVDGPQLETDWFLTAGWQFAF